MTVERCDVAIVGAGLAGATAAVELRARGLSVIILEARDRSAAAAISGSSTARAPMARREIDEELDYGGSWITPWQSTIRGLCAPLRHRAAARVIP